MLRTTIPFAAAGLLAAASALAPAPALAGLFGSVEPEMLYTGSADLPEGVLVIRDADAFAQAVEPLDPAFGAAVPDMKKFVVLRIVGRPRENRCRDTALIEVSTRGMNATAKIEERLPPAECACGTESRPARVYLVTVGRSVRKADLVKTDRVIACPESPAAAAATRGGGPAPQLIFEGSWDAEPGARVIVDQATYREVAAKLGFTERAPRVDFEKDRIVAVTGRARENGCRRTRVLAAGLASAEEVVFEVEESYPAAGQMCAQIFGQPRLFLYRVPATVMRARVVTKEAR